MEIEKERALRAFDAQQKLQVEQELQELIRSMARKILSRCVNSGCSNRRVALAPAQSADCQQSREL
jgi:hypothetical protein